MVIPECPLKAHSLNTTDYLNIVAQAVYGVSAFGEVTRMFNVLGGQILPVVQVSDLLRSIASCDDRANLEQVIRSIDRENMGYIDCL